VFVDIVLFVDVVKPRMLHMQWCVVICPQPWTHICLKTIINLIQTLWRLRQQTFGEFYIQNSFISESKILSPKFVSSVNEQRRLFSLSWRQ